MDTFGITLEDGILTVKVPAPLDAAGIENFTKESKNWLLKPVEIYIFDFTEHEEIDAQLYRHMIILSQCVTKNNRRLACIGLDKKIISQLVADGVSDAFCPIESVEKAIAKFRHQSGAGGKSSIDGRFINPFIDATLKTLSIQANTPGHIGKPYIRSPQESEILTVDIAGIISLASDNFKGSITIGFPEKVFLQIYENMFDEKHESITPEIQDAAAEILNIIYGTAKTELNKTMGHNLKPALPKVLSGAKLSIHQNPTSKTIILPFETSAGAFIIEVAVEKI